MIDSPALIVKSAFSGCRPASATTPLFESVAVSPRGASRSTHRGAPPPPWSPSPSSTRARSAARCDFPGFATTAPPGTSNRASSAAPSSSTRPPLARPSAPPSSPIVTFPPPVMRACCTPRCSSMLAPGGTSMTSPGVTSLAPSVIAVQGRRALRLLLDALVVDIDDEPGPVGTGGPASTTGGLAPASSTTGRSTIAPPTAMS